MPVLGSHYTTGEIARDANSTTHKVEYVIRSRDVKAVERVGVHRLFTESDRQFIISELRRIEAARRPGND